MTRRKGREDTRIEEKKRGGIKTMSQRNKAQKYFIHNKQTNHPFIYHFHSPFRILSMEEKFTTIQHKLLLLIILFLQKREQHERSI
mmetsp:Transcript_11918/g.12845  ORF Transcript_11918/g.12845 Transcript_11918/m.12845 type:complete len:86 (+) Transcript_11918:46-303(+)